MSTQPPSQASLASFTQRKRIYVACVHCRKRKIKCITKSEDTPCERCAERGYTCEYIPIPVLNAKALFEEGEESSSNTSYAPYSPYSSSPPPPNPVSWNTPPPSQRDLNRGDSMRSGRSQQGMPPVNPMSYGQGHGTPAYYPKQPVSQPYGSSPAPQGYNWSGHNQSAPQYTPSGMPSQSQQAAMAGLPAGYNQYYSNPGYNNAQYPPQMYPRRCNCPPGACHCGASR
ncbi:hypothetical protein C8R43DRAFT_1240039 [Mycena crocata]|nr:hypothetical protein C8R43DRAFT_1240039 [Mycena crocata]